MEGAVGTRGEAGEEVPFPQVAFAVVYGVGERAGRRETVENSSNQFSLFCPREGRGENSDRPNIILGEREGWGEGVEGTSENSRACASLLSLAPSRAPRPPVLRWCVLLLLREKDGQVQTIKKNENNKPHALGTKRGAREEDGPARRYSRGSAMRAAVSKLTGAQLYVSTVVRRLLHNRNLVYLHGLRSLRHGLLRLEIRSALPRPA